MKRIIVGFVILAAVFISPAYAYWIWTPKTGKLINPRSAVKPTPKEQFEFAKGLYALDSYEEAKREFMKLLKSYPKSFEASESQYYLGLIEEAQGTITPIAPR